MLPATPPISMPSPSGYRYLHCPVVSAERFRTASRRAELLKQQGTNAPLSAGLRYPVEAPCGCVRTT